MNHSLKKTISAVVAFILSASCFSNMAFAESKLTITGATVVDKSIESITVDGVAEGTKGKGIVAVYSNTGSLKSISFTKDNVTIGDVELTNKLIYDEAAGDTYKVFVWETDEKGNIVAKPLAEAYVSVTPAPIETTDPAASPTTNPTSSPAANPTSSPAANPTSSPAANPTSSPAANPTSSPAANPTSSPVANPTSSPAANPTSSPAAEPTVVPTAPTEPTVVPTAPTEPTDVPTTAPVMNYTVSGTVDAGVKSVSLHSANDADDHTNDIAGTIEGTTVTFTDIAAGKYTVEATAKDGYKDLVISKTEVIVTDANITDAFSITTTVDESKQVLALVHTAHSQWGSNAAEATADNESEYFNNDADAAWSACAYMEFSLEGVDASTLDTAELTFTATSPKGYGSKLFYLTNDVDLTKDLTSSGADRFTGSRVSINDNIPSVQNGVTINQDVTEAVKASLLEGKSSIIIMITGNGGGATLSGKTSKAAPSLVITKGEKAGKELAITVKDSEGNAIAGATVTASVKAEAASLFAALRPVYVTSAKTNENGVATLSLADGNYIITAVKDGKTIKSVNTTVNAESTGTLELKETVYAVAINGGTDSVVIPAGEKYTDPAAFTAAVTADANPVENAKVVWSLATATAGVSINPETGVITVDNTAAAGNVDVKATYTTPENKEVSTTKTVALTAPTIATVTVSGDDEVSIPETGSDVAGSYTVAAADVYGNAIDLTEKTITWAVTADKGVSIANGALTVDSTAADNDKVTITATIDEIVGIKEVTLTKDTTYDVTVNTPENGTLEADKAKAAENRTVTLTVDPATGYEVSEVKVVKTDDATTTVKVDPTDATKYTFTMPAYAVTASVTYKKTDYVITNGTATEGANGSITIAEKANYQDKVEVTVNPNTGYDLATLTFKGTAEGSTVAETAITKDADGKYTFEMPAEAVTVTATFDKVAIADLLPTSYDTASLQTITSNANQTTRDGDRTVTVLTPSAANTDTSVVSITSFGNVLENNVPKIIYFAYDFKLENGDVLLTRPTGGSFTTNQGPTTYLHVVDGKIVYDHQTKGSNGYNTQKTATNLDAGKWYRAVMSGTRNADGTIKSYDLNIYAYDDAGALNSTAAFTKTGLGGRNTNTIVKAFHIGAYAGTPKIDCSYVYTDPYYTATVNVLTAGENESDPTVAVEGATVTVKKGDTTIATGATTETGAFAIENIQAGTYTIEVTKDGYADVTDGTLEVKADGTNSASITLVEQSDPTYDVTVNTVPFATVVLNAGTSTAGTTVETQKVTANANGVATLAKVPAGSYTVNVTSPNKYFSSKTDVAITVVDSATPVNVTLDYKAEYANMIFFDNFSSYAEDIFITGGSSAGTVLAPLGTKYDIWTLVSSTNDWERLAIRGSKNSKDPALLHNNLLDGQYAYFGAFNNDAVYTGTVSENIDKIVLDTNLDGFMGNRTTKMGMSDMDFKIGDTVLFTLTAKPTDAAASIDTIGIKSGDKVLSGKGAWVHVEITGLTTGTATVKITKYNGTELSTEAADTITATISNVVAGNVFTISAAGTNIVNAGQAGGGMAIDNIEIYKSTTTTPVQTYTVTGKAGEGVAKVSLTPATGTAISGTIENGVVTFEDVPAGEYTVTVEAAEGYENPTSNPAKITVSGDTTQAFDATATAIIKTYKVTLPTDTTNGTLSVGNVTSFKKDDTVTITAIPATGKKVKSVTATPTTGDAISATQGTDGTWTFTMPASDVTLSATYANEYTITFEKGANVTFPTDTETTVKYEENETVTFPNATAAEGYNLVWYEGETKVADTSNVTAAKNTTYTAKAEVISNEVELIPGKGVAGTKVNSAYTTSIADVVAGIELKSGDTTVFEGTTYTFLGWATTVDAEDPIRNTSEAIKNIKTLYGVWTAKETFTVTYKGAGKTDTGAPTDREEKVANGGSADLTSIKLDDKDTTYFVGWATEEGAKEALTELTVNSNITLYPVYNNKLVVTVDYSAYGKGENDATTGTLYVKPEGTISEADLEKIIGDATASNAEFVVDGYTYISGDTEAAFEAGTTKITTAITIKPVIGYKQYTVTVTAPDEANGTLSVGELTTAKKGANVTITATAKEGKKVKAVNVTPENTNLAVKVNAGEQANTWTFEMPNSNVTISAEYVDEYTITFAKGEGVTFPENTEPTVKYEKDAKVTFPNADLDEAHKADYNLVWYEGENKVADTSNVTATKDATYTATAKVKTYTVTGTVEEGVESVTLKFGDNTTISGTIEGTTVTFTDVPKGEYTVEATAKAGYKDAVSNPAEITVGETTTSFRVSATKVYTVSGTVDTGVKSVALHSVNDGDNHAKDIEGTISGTSLTFAGVPAGEYTVEATANDGYRIKAIKLDTEEVATVTVTDADVANLSVTSEELTIPYAEGTITYDKDGDVASFVDYSRVTSSVKDGVNSNATKVQDLKSADKGASGAGYNPFTEAYPAKGDAVKVSFDITVPNRNAWISVRGTKPGTGNRDNNATNRIFTIGAEGSGLVKVYSGQDVVDTISDTDITSTWYHVDAVVNNTTKKTAIKIYNYKANNNYANETALYDKTVDFRDSTVEGIVAMDYSSNTNNANIQIDNLYINDPSYVAPISVKATDATVDKAAGLVNDVITITPTAKAGLKVTAVKVNGEVITANNEGAYKYTILGTEDAITVTVDYARADVTSVEISGDTQVSVSAGTANYTAVAKAGTTPVDGTITWSIASAEEKGATIAEGTKIDQSTGVLTLDPAQTAGNIVITASTKKDTTSNSTEAANITSGKMVVAITTESVYNLAVAEGITGGTVALQVGGTDAVQVTESQTLTIVPEANPGYSIGQVYYILTSELNGNDPQWTEVTKTGDAYTISGSELKGDITVKATFNATPYAITNATVSANGNSAAIKIDDSVVETATVGQTVTIVPTVADGYKIESVTVTKADDAETKVTVTNNTFKMPAYAVTVTVTFGSWDGIYYSNTFTVEDSDAYNFLNKANDGDNTKKVTNGVFLFGSTKTNGTRSDYQDLGTPASVDGTYKVTYDWTVGTPGSTGNDAATTVQWLSWSDSNYKVIFGLEVANDKLYLYKGGANSAGAGKCDAKVIWDLTTEAAKAAELISSGVEKTSYKVEATINYNTHKMSIYIKDSTGANTLASRVDEDIVDATSGVRFLSAGAGRIGSVKSTLSNMGLDNIYITAPWYSPNQ